MASFLDPSIKERLWHKLREDLSTYVLELKQNSLLMCCLCGRFLEFEDFDLEHIIPQQALNDDPPGIKANPSTTANVRSGVMLLCRKRLMIKGKALYENGCNSWKGRHYDKCIREMLNGTVNENKFKPPTDQHIIALLCGAFLALVARFGYQCALTPSGLVMREQFFQPRKFHKNLPLNCQMVFGGSAPEFKEEHLEFWLNPFKFTIERETCLVLFRSFAVRLPLSRDPQIPIARHLIVKPTKYKLRPDFSTIFE